MDWTRSIASALTLTGILVGAARCASSEPGSRSGVAPDSGAAPGPGGAPIVSGADASGAPQSDGATDGASEASASDSEAPPASCPVTAADAGGGGNTVAAGAGAAPGPSIPVSFDATGTGLTFDGIGAISGGGGNSRLLFDYPEPYRSQILDYLFKPGFGAALQILKVEIGGDMNSTDGAEASHMHTRTDLACNRGYEWWLMAQAKARNPSIKLYALAWGSPGWIGNGNFWSQDMIDYIVKWLGCATMNGLTIDYLGGWNERGYDKGWFENLHSTLASAHYPAKIVGADNGWEVAKDMASDPAFRASVDILGVHYPCGGDGAPATSCYGDSTAMGLGVPLWASENGSQDLNGGTPAMIRAILRGYLDARMTSFINWPLVAAVPGGLPWMTMGLVESDEPWSGWYQVGGQTWATAHVTQFTQPGWTFIDSASGYLSRGGDTGSYVTLKAPTGGDYSVIAETTTATKPQTLSIEVGNGLSSGLVRVWTTSLASDDTADTFAHVTDITPQGGAFWVTLPPNAITTISTTSGQNKGAYAEPPAHRALLMPYSDPFERYATGTLALYLSDQSGAFEVERCAGARSGQCLRQMSPVAPNSWNSAGEPYTVIGTTDWADYTVAADVLLESPGSVELLGRFGSRDYWAIAQFNGYLLSVSDTGQWRIVSSASDAMQTGTQTTLASGTVNALGTGSWHHLELALKGSTLTASIDGNVVGTAADSTYAFGPAGLGVGLVSASWFNAQFDNLTITPLGPLASPYEGTLINRATGMALDVAGASTSSGAALQQSPINGGASQTWQLAGDRSGYTVLLDVLSGMTVDVRPGAGGALDQEPPDGGGAQHWMLEPSGDSFLRIVSASGLAISAAANGPSLQLAALDCASEAQQWRVSAAPVSGSLYWIMNRATGWLVDVDGRSTASGASVIEWPSNGGPNQVWRLQSAPGGGFVIFNSNSALALAVNSGSAEQATPDGSQLQTWTPRLMPDGFFELASSTGGLLTSPSSNQGTTPLPVTAPMEAESQQEWTLVPVP